MRALLGLLLLLPLLAEAKAPLALVYKGKGVCWKGCAESAAYMASSAGYRVRYVREDEDGDEIFREAALWIQPGGRAVEQAAAMHDALKENIKRFVARGGGYVGFCAGAFLASEYFGWEEKTGERVEVRGLGMLPLKSRFYYRQKTTAAVLPVRLSDGRLEHFYWELGPFMDARQAAPGVDFLAFYPDAEGYFAAAARGSYGSGRVIVAAFHPEAPRLWRHIFGLSDPDDVDYEYARQMLRWASGQ